MCRTKNSFSNEKGLHPHLVRVGDDVLELIEAFDLDCVFVGGDRRGHYFLRTNQHAVFIPGIIKEENFNVSFQKGFSNDNVKHFSI